MRLINIDRMAMGKCITHKQVMGRLHGDRHVCHFGQMSRCAIRGLIALFRCNDMKHEIHLRLVITRSDMIHVIVHNTAMARLEIAYITNSLIICFSNTFISRTHWVIWAYYNETAYLTLFAQIEHIEMIEAVIGIDYLGLLSVLCPLKICKPFGLSWFVNFYKPSYYKHILLFRINPSEYGRTTMYCIT